MVRPARCCITLLTARTLFRHNNPNMPTYEYQNPVEVTELPITVKALATRTGYLNSAVATVNYTQVKVATPAFTPVAGSYPYPVTVSITCETAEATIKYSIDGSEPSLNYTVPLSVSSNTPVKAKAVKTNWLDSDVASVTYEQAQVPIVTFTPGSNAVVFPQTVYLATVLSGATIYYTVGTNPPSPTTSDILYDPDDGVVLIAAGTIKAFAVKTGYMDSDASSATYSQVQVATPSISQSYSPGGGYWYPNTITLACSTSDSTIHYTTDGSTPTSSSTLYTAPFAITSSVTVKARAFKSGYADSDVANRLYDQQRVTATPTISHSNAESGVPNQISPLYPTVITISGESGSTFYYTVDGSTPTNGSTLYSAPFNNTGQTPIKAIAYKTDYLPSAVASQAYTQRVVVTPTFSHPGGEIILGATVSISTATPGCTIYYTTDGSVPDNTDTVYTGPVTISSAITLKAIAYKTGGFQPGSWAVSAVATASYTGPLSPIPVISPNGSGEYEFPVKVLITTASAVDSIYYTTDGSTPDNTDTLYNGAFTVNTDGTVVKAISYKTGYNQSAIATVTINQATFNYTASLSPAANSPIVDGASLTSTLQWQRTVGGERTSGILGSVAYNTEVHNMKALRNGKYMLCGMFNEYGGSPGYAIRGLVRLNQDMTPDVNWRSTSNDFSNGGGSNPLILPAKVLDFAELSDGSIIAVGTFATIYGTTRNYICKFNPDGTLSNTFTTSVSGSFVSKIAVNKDDKILIVGDFMQIRPTGGSWVQLVPPAIALLNPDGTLAAAVNPIGFSSFSNSSIDAICAVADGGFLLAGAVHHSSQGAGVVKLLANGSWPVSPAWTAPMQQFENWWWNRKIYTVKPLRDGRAVIGGSFNTGDFASTPASSKQRIAVLGTTGVVDAAFTSPNLSVNTTGPLNEGNGYVVDVEQMRSGGLFIAGSFRSVGMTANSTDAPYNRHHNMSMINLDGTLVQTNVTGGVGYGVSPDTYGNSAIRKIMLTANDEPIAFFGFRPTQISMPSPSTITYTGEAQIGMTFTGIGKFKFHNSSGTPTLNLCDGEGHDPGTSLISAGVSKFTVNNSDPTLASAALANPGSIALTQTGGVFPTLKLRAAKPPVSAARPSAGAVDTTSGFKLGALTTSTYTWIQAATPVATPGSGALAYGSTVTLTCATSGALIYYTTDGSTPDNTDTLYSGPITISADTTVKAIAYKTGYKPSEVLTESYTQITLDPPVASPAAGSLPATTPIYLSHTQLGILTPAMTSNTTPSGVVTSTGQATATAYQAFDQVNTTAWIASTFGGNHEVAVVYQFPSAKKVYRFDLRMLQAMSPIDLQIQGSNDGAFYTTLFGPLNSAWSENEERTFFPAVVGAFKYYRFVWSRPPQAGSQTTAVSEIKMYGGVDIYYTVDGSSPDLVNRVPVKTTNSIESGWVSSASSELTGFEAWKAFDNDTSTGWKADNNQLVPQSLTAQKSSAETIVAYAVTSDVYAGGPKDFKLQGSNNGYSWTDLDTRTGVTWALSYYPERKQYAVSTPGAYTHYRLYISAVQNNAYEPAVISLELLRYGTAYTAPHTFMANSTITMKAVAVLTGAVTSSVMEAVYNQQQLATPVANPAAGAVPFPTTLALSVAGHDDASIYYTTDGSTPDNTDTLYNAASADIIPAMVSNSMSGYVATASATIVHLGVSYEPFYAFDQAGNAAAAQTIWGAPMGQGTGAPWLRIELPTAQPISAYKVGNTHHTTNYYARAWTLEGSNDASSWTTLDTKNLSSFPYASYITYTLSAPSASYKYYRLNISANNGSPSVVSVGLFQLVGLAGIPISANTTVKAIAYKANYLPSEVLTAAYTQAQLADVTFSPVSGTSGASIITLAQATSGSTIRYTVDGSTPSISNGLTYSGPFVIITPKTVKAYAYKTGYVDSNVATATYP